MMNASAENPRVVRFDEHFARRRRVAPDTLDEVKKWRTEEADAGRPSSFKAYCHSRGLCATCNAEGLILNENGIGFKLVGMDGNMPLFELCPVCGGVGIPTKSGTDED